MSTPSEDQCLQLQTPITHCAREKRPPMDSLTPLVSVESLGIGLVLVSIAGETCVLAEPGRIEQREVHRRLTVHDPLRHHATGHGGMLEAVSAEADGEEESLHAGGGADDGVIVGSEGPQPRPA